jgi:hypothetical protein
MAGLTSKKLFMVFMSMLSLFFLAMIFQNFSFRKDDYDATYEALQGAVRSSDEEHAVQRKSVEPEKAKRDINAISYEPDFAVELEPESPDSADKSLKQ